MSVPYEKTLEKYLCQKVKSLGGMCIKLTGEVGIPDRLVILPNGEEYFVGLDDEKEAEKVLSYFSKDILDKMKNSD